MSDRALHSDNRRRLHLDSRTLLSDRQPPLPLHQDNRLQTLSEISRAVSATLDLHTLYDTIYRQIGRVMDTTLFFIALLGADGETIGLPYIREDNELTVDQIVPPITSVTRLVIASGAPLLFDTDDDYQRYARRHSLPILSVGDDAKDESRSQMFVPLNTGSRTIGALTVQSRQEYAYTQDDLQTLSVIASQAAIAIENARLFTEQQERVIELQAVQRIVQQLTPLQDIPAIATLIQTELTALIAYHSCRIFALDASEGVLVPVALDAGSSRHAMGPRMGEGITGWIAVHGESVLIPNLRHDPRAALIPGTPEIDESMIGVPLRYEGQVQGVVTLTKLGSQQFDANHLRLLEIIAAQAAIAFDRARLYQELRTDAVTDALTALYNRRYLVDRFHEEQSRALRNGHTLVAMMLDIDGFKGVNDTYGHGAGDVVLQELAGVIRGVVRAEDIVTRYGGEEFCLLLPEIPLPDAELVAERAREAIEKHLLPDAAGVRNVTVSVGLAYLNPKRSDIDIFSQADAAMYRVKRLGGNRVGISDARGFRLFGESEPEAIVSGG